jgi:hypothetical protein
LSEVRKLLNIKSDTYESGDLGITSFKDCPYKCVGGILIDPYQHKKEPCPYCQEKRRDLIKYNYKDKSDGKTIEEVLRLPKSFSSVAYDIDNHSFDEILGTIAGDDTILLVLREGCTRANVIDALSLIIPNIQS